MIESRRERYVKKQEFSFKEDKRIGDTGYFTLRGQVYLNEASYLERALEKAVQSGCENIIIDMSLVYIFSSAGIRVALDMYKKNEKRRRQAAN